MEEPGKFSERPELPRTAQRTWWYQRWWLWLVILLPVVVAGPAMLYLSYFLQAREIERELEQVIAELDEKDPQWHLADLATDWEPVADEENAALVVLAAHRLLSAGPLPKLHEQDFHSWNAVYQLRKEQADMLRLELQKLTPFLNKARKLAEHPKSSPILRRSLYDRERTHYHIKVSHVSGLSQVGQIAWLCLGVCYRLFRSNWNHG